MVAFDPPDRGDGAAAQRSGARRSPARQRHNRASFVKAQADIGHRDAVTRTQAEAQIETSAQGLGHRFLQAEPRAKADDPLVPARHGISALGRTYDPSHHPLPRSAVHARCAKPGEGQDVHTDAAAPLRGARGRDVKFARIAEADVGRAHGYRVHGRRTSEAGLSPGRVIQRVSHGRVAEAGRGGTRGKRLCCRARAVALQGDAQAADIGAMSRSHGQPLSPVIVMPWMKVLWVRKNRTSMGAVITVETAISWPQKEPY